MNEFDHLNYLLNLFPRLNFNFTEQAMASEVKDGGEEKVEEGEIRRRGKQVRISFWPQLKTISGEPRCI